MTGRNQPPTIGAGDARRERRARGKGCGTAAPPEAASSSPPARTPAVEIGSANARAAAPPGDDDPMTEPQAAELRALARAAFEPEAYDPKLTSGEAARRIAALRAKLALLDEPPHTL